MLIFNWLCFGGEEWGKYQTRKIKNKIILLLRNVLCITNIRVFFSQNLSVITKKRPERTGGSIVRQRMELTGAENKKGPHARAFLKREPITGWRRFRSGILQRLPETLPYLLFLFPTVPGKLHRALRGTAAHQPCAAFRRCYGPAAGH